MKTLFTFILYLLPFILTAQTSIYNIQYTTEQGDGTYPSLYADEIVTTEGIVTANNFNGGRYFISSPEGGAWNGIFIYDNFNNPQIGDKIKITGLVKEYRGYTEIKDLTSFEIVSSNNTLPEPITILANELSNEAYEGVLVEIKNCEVAEGYDEYGNWYISDTSGECINRSAIFNLKTQGFPMLTGYPLALVRGVVSEFYGLCLVSRYREDIQSEDNAFVLYTENTYMEGNVTLELPVKVDILNESSAFSSYELNITYDSNKLTYNGYEKTGTVSENGNVTDNSAAGNISLNYTGNSASADNTTLVKLKFTPIMDGDANLQFGSSSINGNQVNHTSAGLLTLGLTTCDLPQADTVTVVQRPLLNIPTIVTPGETMNIECFAPANTTNWDAKLIYNDIIVDLPITTSDYNPDLDKWTLKADVPAVIKAELYDLRVTASGDIDDVVSNSVKVIDQYKTDYYFIQITDTHLPGHTFWGRDPGYETDHSEIDDLEEVINDINLLNPEFVLLTGDLLNESELEDFECLRHHTKTVETLQKFEVPVYVVPGNHDLGGWEGTPPVKGTARKEWWRFFGWRQQNGYPVKEEYYVNDYTFDYGNVHFVGLESSDNYDKYMHDVYGDKGFIPSQLTWLENDLVSAGDKTKVLFYHYDFNHDLDLETLGVDMALWGHTHRNINDFTHPYNICTDNVCDGEQAYRVIRVNNKTLSPENTLYVNSGSQNIEISFSDENNGTVDNLTATITNNHIQPFANALVKFVMPQSNTEYIVNNGNLKQVIRSNGNDIYYVNVNLEAHSNVEVSVKKDVTTAINAVEANGGLEQNFPNPFKTTTEIKFALKQRAKVKLMVYNTNGQQIKVLTNEVREAGKHVVKWDGTNSAGMQMPAGIYFYTYTINGKQVASKQMVYNK